MYPYELIPNTGINLYLVFIVVGIIATMITFRLLSSVVKLPAKVFNFVLVTAVVAIVVGWLFAMLFQAVYNYTATGVFEFRGQTFLGGLLGGVGVFLFVYFVIGRFLFKEGENVKAFPALLTIGIPSIVVAHAFGRIGCLTAGCCYGGVTHEWYGINMYSAGEWNTRVPTQLMESLFLFLLFAALVVLILRFKWKNTTSVYLIAYGVWRFFIEFVRDDAERGASIIKGLYPSQVISIIMVVCGVVLIFFYDKIFKEKVANEQNG